MATSDRMKTSAYMPAKPTPQSQPCPHKEKLVNQFLQYWACAELESEVEGISVEWVYWRNRQKRDGKVKPRVKKKPKPLPFEL